MQIAITIEQAQQNFELSQIGEVSPATIRWYKHRLTSLVEFLGNVAIAEITINDLRRWRVWLLEKNSRWASHSHKPEQEGGLSTWTIRGYIRAIRRFFNWLVEEGYLPSSPAQRLKMPPKPEEPPKAVSDEDLQKFLKEARATSPRDYAIVCFLADTGCRVGGLIGLTLEDLNLVHGRATVREKGRGGKNKARTVYLMEETKEAIEVWLQERPSTGSKHVFVGIRGPLKDSGVYQMLQRLGKRAGVNGRCNPHAFRHGWARGALKNGADLATVSQILGHSSIQVTADFYARWADEELAQRHRKYSWLKPTQGKEPEDEESSAE